MQVEDNTKFDLKK